MRFQSGLLLVCAATCAAPTSGTSQEFRLHYSNEATGSNFRTDSQPLMDSSLRVQIEGRAGEWVRLLSDAHLVTNSTKYAWLNPVTPRPPSSTVPNSYWLPEQHLPSIGVHLERCAFGLTVGVNTFGKTQANGPACQDWYVPLLVAHAGMPRMWDSDPEMWRTPNAGLGNGSASSYWWQSTTMQAMTGTGTSEVFSVEALLRWSVLLRAVATVSEHGQDPFEITNDFFDDGTVFGAPSQTGPVLALLLQAIGLTREDDPPAGATDAEAPILGPPAPQARRIPIGRVTTHLVLPFILPKPGTSRLAHYSTENVYGLDGALEPGKDAYFHAFSLLPPVEIRFETTTGPEFVRAYSAVSRDNALRHRVRVPSNLIRGDIGIRTAWYPNRVDIVGEAYASKAR